MLKNKAKPEPQQTELKYIFLNGCSIYLITLVICFFVNSSLGGLTQLRPKKMHASFVIFLLSVCYSIKLGLDEKYAWLILGTRCSYPAVKSKLSEAKILYLVKVHQYNVTGVPQQSAFLLVKGISENGMFWQHPAWNSQRNIFLNVLNISSTN